MCVAPLVQCLQHPNAERALVFPSLRRETPQVLSAQGLPLARYRPSHITRGQSRGLVGAGEHQGRLTKDPVPMLLRDSGL